MINNVVEELIRVIEALEGSKVVTLLDNENKSWQFDFSKDGRVNNDEMLLRTKMAAAMDYKGSIVIRQVMDIKKDGMPLNKIYGIYLHNHDWTPISPEDMEYAHTWGEHEKLPREKNVVYASLNKG